MDAFFTCDRFTFPNICVLLHLALTMPITSCESERSFSKLKLLKTPSFYNFCCSSWLTIALMEINKEWCNKLQEPCMRNGETSPIILSNAPKACAVAMYWHQVGVVSQKVYRALTRSTFLRPPFNNLRSAAEKQGRDEKTQEQHTKWWQLPLWPPCNVMHLATSLVHFVTHTIN